MPQWKHNRNSFAIYSFKWAVIEKHCLCVWWIQMNITTFGTMFPLCYWLVTLYFEVILPGKSQKNIQSVWILGFFAEVTVGMHVFIPLAIMANSIYAIVSSKVSWEEINIENYHTSFQALSCKTIFRRPVNYTKTPTTFRTRFDNSTAIRYWL